MTGDSITAPPQVSSPESADVLADVIAGLSSNPRAIPCKYFYDERGAALFQKICELPEYYVTRTEIDILERHGAEIALEVGPDIELIGLGTGAGTKTRILIEALDKPAVYMPVDISEKQLHESAALFRQIFPDLEVLPVCADYLQPVVLPTPRRNSSHKVVYFPGSTLGNFEPDEAADFLRRIARLCGDGGGLLIGVDLQKDPRVIEAAYNDTQGVTAEFNLNLLVRANRELGADFDLQAVAASRDLQFERRPDRDVFDQRKAAGRAHRRTRIFFSRRRENSHRVFLQTHAGKFFETGQQRGIRVSKNVDR